MTPERVAALVARWVRFYTRDLPPRVARRRVGEIDADLHDHIAHERDSGASDWRIAVGVLSRMVRGVAADIAWRAERVEAITDRPSTAGGSQPMNTTAYRFALALALATVLFLLWGAAAMGLIGAEGDRFDLMYIGVLAVGIIGAVLVRFKPQGMVRVLLGMAVTQALIAVIALLVGKHESPVSSVAEILGVNGMYVALFVGSAWLFRRAADQRPPA
jgi:hypothetical protein